MTNEQALEIYNSMLEIFGSKIPDPEHQPIQFKYYYKLFKWIKQNEQSNNTISETSPA